MDRVAAHLLGRLHSVFNPDPGALLALRVRHAAGATWRVHGETLEVTADGATWVAALEDVTLGELATALQAAGFEVAYLNSAVAHLSALTLLEGSGDQGESNGDHLSIYTAPLAVLLAALGQALGEGRAAIAAALAQLILPQATHEWADLFGDIFGIARGGTVAASPYHDLARAIARYRPIGTSGHELTLHAAWETFFANLLSLPRRDGESATHYHDRLVYAARQRAALDAGPLEADGAYTARIIAEVQRARASPAALLRNIQRATGADLSLREPWQEMAYLSVSPLSGTDHLQGAPIYEYHRIQLVAPRGLDWTPVLREAEADRPAGTLLLPPATHMPALHLDGVSLTVQANRVLAWAEALPWQGYGRLSVDLNLSSYLPPPPTALSVVAVKALWSKSGLRGPYEYTNDPTSIWQGEWDARTWSQGVVTTPELYPPKSIPAA